MNYLFKKDKELEVKWCKVSKVVVEKIEMEKKLWDEIKGLEDVSYDMYEKGAWLSANLDINRARAISLLFNACTFLIQDRLFMLMIARHLVGFVSIPCLVNMNPGNFLAFTSNTQVF